ncbi:YiiD C-terminal domain-containing protein [Marinospirillum insulare]|uniref:Thioesterase putative domain-containing protein n=1 Tax=Marinospirillum insulare TaxID=217169 RepID=A0ABQ5ZXK6_9GAMM|nr:YiiD C-terminal domain-containing protein [Marinospirillum insulare]GLR62624.1 hypothetical protein GCM10007878_00590 [Marinospirillum insulare]
MKPVNAAFLPWLNEAIPLTKHLGIKSIYWQKQRLAFDLELAPLVNDKGTGFGGGVAGIATLLGWCFVTLLLDETNQLCPVVVKDSNNAFTAPITEDFIMRCEAVDPSYKEGFLQQLNEKGRARLKLKVWVEQAGEVAFSYEGTYVALGKH